jgi:hypothetical protein
LDNLATEVGEMNKRFVSILAIVAIVLGIANSLLWVWRSAGAAPLSAPDVPQLIGYQGRLTDAASNPLTGQFDMRFCLYAEPTDGTALWCETHAAVNDTPILVSDGVFSVLLGSVTPIPESAFDELELYLGVKVESDDEMTPRRRVVSVGYAYRAEEASTANYASSAGDADYASSAGNADHATSASNADAASYASSAGNADTVDYMHASDFANASHTHDASDITSGTLPDNLVGREALRTSLSLIAHTSPQGWNDSNYVVTGGSYCFYPQLKMWGGHSERWGANIYNDTRSRIGFSDFTTTICLSTGSVGVRIDAQFRCVTSSGQDFWVFLLADKSTGEIIAASAAPDHPSYGNGGDPEKIPHPFADYARALPDNYEIVLLGEETSETLREEAGETGETVIELLFTEYKVDMTRELEYEPLHSGKFLGEEPVLIESIPEYIKVRGLIKLTEQEKADRELRRQQAEQLR